MFIDLTGKMVSVSERSCLFVKLKSVTEFKKRASSSFIRKVS